jgi:hypothetical protein
MKYEHEAFMQEVVLQDDPTIRFNVLPAVDLNALAMDLTRQLMAILVLRKRHGKPVTFSIRVTSETTQPADAKPLGLPATIAGKVEGPITSEVRKQLETQHADDDKLIERIDKFGKNLTDYEIDFIEDMKHRLAGQMVMTPNQRHTAERIDDERVT